jgi:hemoglobin
MVSLFLNQVMSMADVATRKNIEEIVDRFYDKLLKDEKLSHIFKPINLEKHLPVVCNFWENMLFQTGNYSGGMMWVHLQQNEKTPLTAELFERWLALFFMTIDEGFQGGNADFMKKKALEIGQIMNAKIQHINSKFQT